MEFSAAKSVGNSKKYICLSMKNRSNITEPAAHSSIMSSKQLLQAISVCFLVSVCVFVYFSVYLYMSSCTDICMYIYACECVCVPWQCCDSYLDMFVIIFHQYIPFPIPKQPMGKCPFFFFGRGP